MEYPYELIRSRRKTIGIQIRDGAVIVRAPSHVPKQEIDAFVLRSSAWIEKHLRLQEEQRKKGEAAKQLAEEKARKEAEQRRAEEIRQRMHNSFGGNGKGGNGTQTSNGTGTGKNAGTGGAADGNANGSPRGNAQQLVA